MEKYCKCKNPIYFPYREYNKKSILEQKFLCGACEKKIKNPIYIPENQLDTYSNYIKQHINDRHI